MYANVVTDRDRQELREMLGPHHSLAVLFHAYRTCDSESAASDSVQLSPKLKFMDLLFSPDNGCFLKSVLVANGFVTYLDWLFSDANSHHRPKEQADEEDAGKGNKDEENANQTEGSPSRVSV